MTLLLGLFIGATIGYITAALMAAPNYSEIPTSSTTKDTVEEGPEINEVLDKIKAEIRPNCFIIPSEYKYGAMMRESDILFIIDKYKAESDIEKRKPCINYSDGCEEWAGCPCVYYKAAIEAEGK